MAFPFAAEEQAEAEDCRGGQCSLRSLLPQELQEQCDAAPHLMEYLHLVPVKDVGVPLYAEDLNRKHSDLDDPNLIYRVDDELFIHIFPDKEDARNFYIAIEPAMVQDLQPLL